MIELSLPHLRGLASSWHAGQRFAVSFGECCMGRRPTAAVWPAAVGLGLSGPLHRVLASARQCAWAGTSAALVCQPLLGASLRKGWFRMIGHLGGRFRNRDADGVFPPKPRGVFSSV